METDICTTPASGRCLDRRLTVRLDGDRFCVLEDMARREGFSVSVIVRHLVYRYIEQQRRFAVGR